MTTNNMAPAMAEVNAQVDTLVKKASQAAQAFLELDQERVDAIVKAMTLVGVEKHMELAHLAVEETGMGVYEDKVIKNLFSTEYIYNTIKDLKTVGVVAEHPAESYVEIAEPVGVVAGVTPVTNPTSTTMFKAIIAMKTRNPIVFSFHPKAQRCSVAAAQTMLDAALKAGAPENCISWITEPSIEATNALMRHPDVAMILATGGSGLVKAAYSSGKPALGVGPGNVPAFIEASADVAQAVNDVVLSKTFDNGVICASEQAVVVDKTIAAQVEQEFVRLGAYFLQPEEIKKVEQIAIDPVRQAMSPKVVGQPAVRIAEMAGVKAPVGTKLLIARLQGVGPAVPLSQEKLSPILGFYVVDGAAEGIKVCQQLTEFGGLGHSAVIHSNNQAVIDEFSLKVRTGRILVNSPSSQGAIGDIYNGLNPSLTLGCGSMGHNSTTANVGVMQLINVKRRATRKVNMQWFKVPPKIYFEPGSLQYLAAMRGTRAVIVTDHMMVQIGHAAKVEAFLKQAGMAVEIFADVEPDPSVDTVQAGCAVMQRFKPDVIVALGGGSPMDAAKGMWLFYESPDTDFTNLRLKFQDIRKRAFRFPQLGRKATFVAIPTTSGTGSEVTAFAVITDKKNNMKYPLADYELTPDIAIVDPDLVMTVPPKVTADTGIDVLVHAIEAYVSVMASDFTDGLALKAAELVFKYLPTAYKEPGNALAREKMHNASTLAGMAFTNAFLGVNHSLAHKLGARFHIPHGRANSLLLQPVVRYNAGRPAKLVPFPKYNRYKAAERYAEIARYLGMPAGTTEEGVQSLLQAIDNLQTVLDMPRSIKETGIKRDEFAAAVKELAEQAFGDQCTISNPRLPLVTELEQLYWQAYEGAAATPVASKDRKAATQRALAAEAPVAQAGQE